MMIRLEENASYQQIQDCSSIAKGFVLNINESKSDTIVIIFNIALNVVPMFTASLGNGMIIVAILRSQNLQTPSYLLITSLAFTDLLIGLIFHPLHIVLNVYNLQGNIEGVCRMIKYYVYLTACLGIASSLMMTCISIDRYLALTLRHRYNIIVTKKRVRLLILFVWIATFVASFPVTIAIGAFDIFISFLSSALLLTTCFFYIKSYRALHRYTVQVQAQQPNPLVGNFDVVRYQKTLKTMLVVMSCFVVCSIPLIIAMFTRAILRHPEEFIAFNLVAFTLVSLNSSINPAIYLIRFGDIRSACYETLTHLVEMVT